MKNLSLLVFILVNMYCLSQTNELYVLVNDKSLIDTISSGRDNFNVFLKFSIDFNDRPLKSGLYTFEIDKDNKLRKRITIKGATRTEHFSFIYKNIENDNPPVFVRKDSIVNKITYKEIMEANDFTNVSRAIRFFKTIYFINEDEEYDDYHIAKKVEMIIP